MGDSSLALAQTPMRTLLLQNLATQTASISHLFTALTAPAPNPAAVQASYAVLGTSTDELAAVLREAERHQEAWGRVMRQRKAVEDLERRVRGLCRDLERGSRELGAMVDEAKAGLTSGEGVPLNVPALLAHAQALAKTSSAPTSTLLTPADRAQSLPWPSEASMRMGLLFQTQGSMTQGETGTLGDEIPLATSAMDMQVDEVQHHAHEERRQYDPDAVYNLDLNSDSDDG